MDKYKRSLKKPTSHEILNSIQDEDKEDTSGGKENKNLRLTHSKGEGHTFGCMHLYAQEKD